VTIVDIEEYNAFGPWIGDVRTPEDVPRVFRTHDFDPASAALAIKIPRNIARRDARPGMDLFDRLLIVDDRAFTVLTRAEGTFTTASLPISAIAAFEDSVDLLDGRLIIRSADAAIEIAYNGSSHSSIQRLIDVLRPPRLPTPAATGPASGAPAGWRLHNHCNRRRWWR